MIPEHLTFSRIDGHLCVFRSYREGEEDGLVGSGGVGVDDERIDGCLRGRNWFDLLVRALSGSEGHVNHL
jgi:hypothetical protein